MRELHRRTLFPLSLGLLMGLDGCVFEVTDYRVRQGEPCSFDAQCVTGHCSGVCCDRPCDDVCEACMEDITGVADGVCAPLLLGEKDPEAPECNNKGGCGADNQCGCDDGRLGPGESDVDCGGVCEEECASP